MVVAEALDFPRPSRRLRFGRPPSDDPIDGAPVPHHAEIDNRIAQSCGSGRSDEKDSRHQLVLDSLAHTLDRIDWCGQAVLLLMIKAAYSHSAVY
jgi:hypothetical protein